VALSNGNADVQRVGLGAYFSASLSAQQFGVAKPDPRIFEAAAAAAAVAPAEVLHVGDDVDTDVMGALNSGLQAVWVNREAKAWPHASPAPWTISSLHELCRHLVG